MADGVNGYNNEEGFLCSFTDEELVLIKATEVVTQGNALAESEVVVTQDKVFLLSMDELMWFTEADVSLMAVPTVGAVANDKSTWYKDYCLDYGVEATMWWLRKPVESFGIRPAMTIALDADK